MSACTVVHHTCRRSEDDGGLPFDCACGSKITLKEARELVAKGLATWKQQRNANGKIIASKGAVVARHRVPRLRQSPASKLEGEALWEMLKDRGHNPGREGTLAEAIDLVEQRSPYHWL